MKPLHMGRETGPTVLTILDNYTRNRANRQQIGALFSVDEQLMQTIGFSYHSQPLIREEFQYEDNLKRLYATQVHEQGLDKVLKHDPVVWTKKTDFGVVNPQPLFKNYLLRYKEIQLQETLKGSDLTAMSAYRELIEPVIEGLLEGRASSLAAIDRFLSTHPNKDTLAIKHYQQLTEYMKRGPSLIDEPIIRYHALMTGAHATRQVEAVQTELQLTIESLQPTPLYAYKNNTINPRTDESGNGPSR